MERGWKNLCVLFFLLHVKWIFLVRWTLRRLIYSYLFFLMVYGLFPCVVCKLFVQLLNRFTSNYSLLPLLFLLIPFSNRKRFKEECIYDGRDIKGPSTNSPTPPSWTRTPRNDFCQEVLYGWDRLERRSITPIPL